MNNDNQNQATGVSQPPSATVGQAVVETPQSSASTMPQSAPVSTPPATPQAEMPAPGVSAVSPDPASADSVMGTPQSEPAGSQPTTSTNIGTETTQGMTPVADENNPADSSSSGTTGSL